MTDPIPAVRTPSPVVTVADMEAAQEHVAWCHRALWGQAQEQLQAGALSPHNAGRDWRYSWRDGDRRHIEIEADGVVTEIPVGTNPIGDVAVWRAIIRHATGWNRPRLALAMACAWPTGGELTVTRRRVLEVLGA